MRTLDTSKKEYKEKLDNYIYDCIENCDVELSNDEKIIYFMSEFDRVANYPNNIKHHPNIVDRIDDYLMGLPFNFDFSNYWNNPKNNRRKILEKSYKKHSLYY